MIVYGDPNYSISSAEARERLEDYFECAESIDGARDLVIALGQIEQAIADSDADTRSIMEATDRAAEFFIQRNLGKMGGVDILLASRESALRALDGPGELRIKIPEGFAFYSLFPEQYIAAAEIYSEKSSAGKILVVGIRSIGTTLSGIVKAALNARGFQAERITVRPRGHPFERETQLDAARQSGPVIIVDEGPGLSGSSMASVAAAFRAHGTTDVTFFPGHANPPGHAASAKTKRIWSETPTIVKPQNIQNLLHRETELLLGPAKDLKDLSAGGWTRQIHRANIFHAVPQFERTKLLVQSSNGGRLLWKFAGLGPGRDFQNLAATAFTRQHSLAAQNWCSPALATSCGFIATEWLDLPHPQTADHSTATRLANYIIAASKHPLTESQTTAAIQRLREMMLHNFDEAGLNDLAAAAEKLESDPRTPPNLPSYGDGRMAPHEFLLSSGKLLKTDVWGHDSDHTIVGPQPLLWDIAGTIIEWNLPPSFLTHFDRRDLQINSNDLLFYLYAYTAFRLGMTSLAGNTEALADYGTRAEVRLKSYQESLFSLRP